MRVSVRSVVDFALYASFKVSMDTPSTTSYAKIAYERWHEKLSVVNRKDSEQVQNLSFKLTLSIIALK